MSKISIAQVNAKIESHMAVSAERWLEVINRVKRLEHFIVATLITLVIGMAGIIFGLRRKNMQTFANIAAIIMTIVTTCSVIAMITPTPQRTGWMKSLYKIIDIGALNLWKAKDK